MASNQYMVYDTDGGGFVSQTAQTININENSSVLVRAAGLEEEVQIYQMVGVCSNCRASDVLWAPLTYCGEPVILSEENNSVWLNIPGRYSIGDPNDPPVLTGDVNITGQNMTGVDTSLMGKPCVSSSDEPQDVTVTNAVTIDSSCDEPISVSICDQTPIETAMVNLGCITDENGTQIGVVMLTKITDENTGAETLIRTAFYEDGTQVDNYTGPWSVCAPDACLVEEPIGLITTFDDI